MEQLEGGGVALEIKTLEKTFRLNNRPRGFHSIPIFLSRQSGLGVNRLLIVLNRRNYR